MDWLIRFNYLMALLGGITLLFLAPLWTLGFVALYVGLCVLMEPPRG